MTREEAIKVLNNFPIDFRNSGGFEAMEALKIAILALRPVSREQVEKVWKSEWIDNGGRDPNGVPNTFAISCKRCGSSAGTSWMRFCPACGAPMTDEAVEMVMERMDELQNEIG